VPSQFSHEILNANPYAYLDDAPLEERRARAVEMRRILPESVLEEVGKLDPTAIAQVREEAWPDMRDADELHDVLHTLIALPEAITAHVEAGRPTCPNRCRVTGVWSAYLKLMASVAHGSTGQPTGVSKRNSGASEWPTHFKRLLEQGRATRAEHAGASYWLRRSGKDIFAALPWLRVRSTCTGD